MYLITYFSTRKKFLQRSLQKLLKNPETIMKSILVRITGLEPARLTAIDPKSIASANSAIPAIRLDAKRKQNGDPQAT